MPSTPPPQGPIGLYGCLFLYVVPVTDRWPVQGSSAPLVRPLRGQAVRIIHKWYFSWTFCSFSCWNTLCHHQLFVATLSSRYFARFALSWAWWFDVTTTAFDGRRCRALHMAFIKKLFSAAKLLQKTSSHLCRDGVSDMSERLSDESFHHVSLVSGFTFYISVVDMILENIWLHLRAWNEAYLTSELCR